MTMTGVYVHFKVEVINKSFMHAKGMGHILYVAHVFSQKMILIWLTCIQDYIIQLSSEQGALHSHFLCQSLSILTFSKL